MATGATTARIRILDINLLGGDYEHYTPGIYELVAVGEDASESIEISMRPELRIVDVRQYRAGDQANDYGKLAVAVENVGTAPTWVYNITYRNAPNFASNDELFRETKVLSLDYPTEFKETIVLPGERQSYVGLRIPFLFRSKDQHDCQTQTEVEVIVESAIGEPLRQSIRANVGGEIVFTGLTGEYTCTDISIEMMDEITNE